MSKSRRNVRFPRRMSNSSEGRRLSISDASDVLSDPGSPAKDGSVTAPATIPEEVRSCELSGNPREGVSVLQTRLT